MFAKLHESLKKSSIRATEEEDILPPRKSSFLRKSMRKSLSKRFTLRRRSNKELPEVFEVDEDDEVDVAEEHKWDHCGLSLELMNLFADEILECDRTLVEFIEDYLTFPKGTTGELIEFCDNDEMDDDSERCSQKRENKERDDGKLVGGAQSNVKERKSSKVPRKVLVKVKHVSRSNATVFVRRKLVRLKDPTEWSMGDILKYIVQEDGAARVLQCSFARSFAERVNAPLGLGIPHAGIYVVVSNETRYFDLLNSLQLKYEDRDPSETYIWTSILCGKMQESKISTSLERVVRSHHLVAIPHFEEVILFIDSWLCPLVLRNVDCVSEAYSSLLGGKEVRPLYRLGADEEFSATLLSGDHDSILNHLADFDTTPTRKMSASHHSIKHSLGGYIRVNYRMTAKIREWLEETIQRCLNLEWKVQSQERIAEMMMQCGRLLHQNGQYSVAKAHLVRALELLEDIHGVVHEGIVHVLSALSCLLLDMNDIEASQELDRRVEKIESTKGLPCLRAREIFQVAHSRARESKHDSAIKLYQSALETVSKEASIEAKELAAVALHQMGRVYESARKPRDAREMYEAAREAMVEFENFEDRGLVHPMAAVNFFKLGNLYHQEGKFEDSLRAFQKALPLNVRSYGEIHKNVAEDWEGMGTAFEALGNLKAAERAFLKTLEIYLSLFGAESPQFLSIKSRLAKLKSTQSRVSGSSTKPTRHRSMVSTGVENTGPTRRVSKFKDSEG